MDAKDVLAGVKISVDASDLQSLDGLLGELEHRPAVLVDEVGNVGFVPAHANLLRLVHAFGAGDHGVALDLGSGGFELTVSTGQFDVGDILAVEGS